MPTSKYSRFFLVLLVLIFLGQLFAQTDSTSTIDIYRQAYQSAFKDREISPDESNLLKNLQKSLNISDEAVNRIQQEIAQSAPQMRDQSGRWPLVMQNMAYGAGLYGWGIPFLLDVKDEKWYIGGEMLSLGGSFYLTYQFTKNMDISHARAQMLRYGSLIGLHATSGFCLLVAPEKPKFMVTMMMAGVPAGMIVMDRFYKKWQPSLGQSWAITQWGELGYSGVSNLYQMFDPQPKDPSNDKDMDYNEDDPVNQLIVGGGCNRRCDRFRLDDRLEVRRLQHQECKGNDKQEEAHHHEAGEKLFPGPGLIGCRKGFFAVL